MESSLESSSTLHPTVTASSSSMEETSTSYRTEEQSGVSFIRHQVSKLDTLAGLAIKYNVSVGDIKRANGLLSDSALYARSSILIPTGTLPIGQELQRICAQVLTGVSRDPVLHADSQTQPASAAVARIATSLNVVSGHSYPDDLPISECAWIAMCQCGTCGPMDPNGLCTRNLAPVELELTDRSSEGMYLPPASAGPTRQHDAVRRRRNAADDGDSSSDNSFGWGGAQRTSAGAASASRRPAGDSSSDNGRLAAWFSEIGKAIGEGVSSTVAKVKEAANQPVLARPLGSPQGSSYSAMADAVIASRRRTGGPGSMLGRAPFEGGGSSGSLAGGAGGGMGAAVAAAGAARAKQGGKCD